MEEKGSEQTHSSHIIKIQQADTETHCEIR
jgi:hypothetical protein